MVQKNLKNSSNKMKWTDIHNIAIELEDLYPQKDIININFTELQKLVLDIHGFNDDPKRCNEKILEAIQMAWLDERE